MKIIKNEKLINRNAKIGQGASLAGLLAVAGSMYYSAQFLMKPETAGNQNMPLLLGILFVSLILAQIGMYFGNRFGRRPRPDELLDAALKGLPGDYSLYHYSTVVPHLLVGPAGACILLPYHQKGKIGFTNNRWRASGGGFLQGYMRIFGQESLGRPDIEALQRIESLTKFLHKKLGSESNPTVSAALVFLDAGAELDATGSPLPAMQVKKLKDFIRKAAKDSSVPPATLDAIRSALPV